MQSTSLCGISHFHDKCTKKIISHEKVHKQELLVLPALRIGLLPDIKIRNHRYDFRWNTDLIRATGCIAISVQMMLRTCATQFSVRMICTCAYHLHVHCASGRPDTTDPT
jgi:hypothetical protein